MGESGDGFIAPITKRKQSQFGFQTNFRDN
jgi:hypothetical protein